MLSEKYKNILKISIIVIAIIIVALVGYIGVTKIKLRISMKEANEFAVGFSNLVASKQTEGAENTGNTANSESSSTQGTAEGSEITYKENKVAGIIEIAGIGLNTVVLEEEKVSTLEETAGILTGAGLNNMGNTVIVGQSYYKDMAFHDIENLNLEDEIKITDIKGTQKTYIINNIYKTDKADKKYIIENTQGNTRITLVTYTNKEILVIQADAK